MGEKEKQQNKKREYEEEIILIYRVSYIPPCSKCLLKSLCGK